MKQIAILACIILFRMVSGVLATPLDDLSSPNQNIRDKAAAELRTTFQQVPQSKWQPLFDAIKEGQNRQEVLKVLATFNVSASEGRMSSGGTYTEVITLDDCWKLSCYYANNTDKLLGKELNLFLKTVHATMPNDFTGKWIDYYVNCQKAFEADCINGKMTGEEVSYDQHGNKYLVRHFFDNQQEGVETGYYPSGHIEHQGQFKGGKEVGKWLYYDEHGTTIRTEEFTGDYEYCVTFPEAKGRELGGELSYEHQELSGVFEHVITPAGEYVVTYGQGWMRVPGGPIFVGGTPKSTTTNSYIAGLYDFPPDGVGTEWLYVVGKHLWVDPKKMIEVLNSGVMQAEQK